MKSETPRANWRTWVSEDEGEQVEAEPAAEVVVAAEVAVTPARRRLTMLKRIALGVISEEVSCRRVEGDLVKMQKNCYGYR